MKLLNNEELKKIELEILDDFHMFCESHDLKYSLAYGTLLGAARHKGFIPWDDDIDVMMPIEDYNKFINIYESERYELLKPTCKNSPFIFLKLFDKRTLKNEPLRKKYSNLEIGVDIDIFPINYASDSDTKNMRRMNILLKLQKLLYMKVTPVVIKSIKSFFVQTVLFCLPISLIKSMILFYSNKENDTNKKGCLVQSYGVNEIMDKSVFEDYETMFFEDREYKAIKCYDEYLSKVYGNNYMELPPLEKRQTHHTFSAYIKNSSVSKKGI